MLNKIWRMMSFSIFSAYLNFSRSSSFHYYLFWTILQVTISFKVAKNENKKEPTLFPQRSYIKPRNRSQAEKIPNQSPSTSSTKTLKITKKMNKRMQFSTCEFEVSRFSPVCIREPCVLSFSRRRRWSIPVVLPILLDLITSFDFNFEWPVIIRLKWRWGLNFLYQLPQNVNIPEGISFS